MSKNFQAISAHYDASSKGDLEGMMGPVTPETRWTEMAGFPYAGTYVGPDEIIKGVFMRIGADWPGYAFALESLHDAGDTIIGIGTYSGVYKATGKHMTARVVHVWTMHNGKANRFEQFTDTKLVADAMV
jgi:uncharacterized protein